MGSRVQISGDALRLHVTGQVSRTANVTDDEILRFARDFDKFDENDAEDFERFDKNDDKVIDFGELAFLQARTRAEPKVRDYGLVIRDTDKEEAKKILQHFGGLVKTANTLKTTVGHLNIGGVESLGLSFPNFVFKNHQAVIIPFLKISQDGQMTLETLLAWMKQELLSKIEDTEYVRARMTDIIASSPVSTLVGDTASTLGPAAFEEIFEKIKLVDWFRKYDADDNGELSFSEMEQLLVKATTLEESPDGSEKSRLQKIENKVGKMGRRILASVGLKSEDALRRAKVKTWMREIGRSPGKTNEKEMVVSFGAFLQHWYKRRRTANKSSARTQAYQGVPDMDEWRRITPPAYRDIAL